MKRKASDEAADLRALLDETPATADVVAQLQAASTDLDSDPEFVAGYLKAQFVESILQVMEVHGLNKNSLAKKLGKSRQYIGRILNEKSNFTIESMVEISCALGMQLTLRMHDPQERIAIPVARRRQTRRSRAVERKNGPLLRAAD